VPPCRTAPHPRLPSPASPRQHASASCMPAAPPLANRRPPLRCARLYTPPDWPVSFPQPRQLPARRVTSHSASPPGSSPARGQCHDIFPHRH
jgi:hypothetical protein